MKREIAVILIFLCGALWAQNPKHFIGVNGGAGTVIGELSSFDVDERSIQNYANLQYIFKPKVNSQWYLELFFDYYFFDLLNSNASFLPDDFRVTGKVLIPGVAFHLEPFRKSNRRGMLGVKDFKLQPFFSLGVSQLIMDLRNNLSGLDPVVQPGSPFAGQGTSSSAWRVAVGLQYYPSKRHMLRLNFQMYVSGNDFIDHFSGSGSSPDYLTGLSLGYAYVLNWRSK